jgi:hypothetical protein
MSALDLFLPAAGSWVPAEAAAFLRCLRHLDTTEGRM